MCLVADEWSRPIFGLTSNYKGMTREERQQRDLDQQMPQRRRLRYRRDSAVSAETVIDFLTDLPERGCVQEHGRCTVEGT